jgi:ribosome-associated protein
VIEVPIQELRFQFARSGGAGGQNVNKVSSKAVLRWLPGESTAVPAAVRQRFLVRFASRLTTGGELVLASQRYRDRGRNVADCVERLRAMLAEVEHAPRSRTPTRPSRSAVTRRLDAKRRRAVRKRERSTREDD